MSGLIIIETPLQTTNAELHMNNSLSLTYHMGLYLQSRLNGNLRNMRHTVKRVS